MGSLLALTVLLWFIQTVSVKLNQDLTVPSHDATPTGAIRAVFLLALGWLLLSIQMVLLSLGTYWAFDDLGFSSIAISAFLLPVWLGFLLVVNVGLRVFTDWAKV